MSRYGNVAQWLHAMMDGFQLFELLPKFQNQKKSKKSKNQIYEKNENEKFFF